MELGLSDSVGVQVVAPALSPIEMPAPGPNVVTVVPIEGPRGVPGPPGDPAEVQDIVDAAITTHVVDPEPHPAYDDMPTLRLIFENGLI